MTEQNCNLSFLLLAGCSGMPITSDKLTPLNPLPAVGSKYEAGFDATGFIMWLLVAFFMIWVIYQISRKLVEKLEGFSLLRSKLMKLTIKGKTTLANASNMLLDPNVKSITIEKNVPLDKTVVAQAQEANISIQTDHGEIVGLVNPQVTTGN